MESNIVDHRIIRLINTSLNVCLPAAYCRERGLRPGDHVVIIRDGDELRLRFVKTQVEGPTQAQEPANVE